MAQTKKSEIKQDLIDQLERQGVYGRHYIDLINDYMDLWDIKNELIKDIKARGVNTKYQNGPDQWGYKRNDGIAELNKVIAQMLKILNDLGLKAQRMEPEPDKDEDM